MICYLPTPLWTNPYRVGLNSAVENIALQKTTIAWAQAQPSPAAPFVFYNIYWSDDPIELFDQPRAFAIDRLTADIPYTLANDGYYFAVRATQMGVAEDFSLLSNMAINATAYAYPAPPTSVASFSTLLNTAALEVTSTAGFPLTDGYVQIGDEIVLYSSIGISSGNPAFIISNWNPFGCNDGYTFPAGYAVSLFKGFEEGNTVFFQRTSACSFDLPTWADPFRPGIQFAEDLGLGSVIKTHWKPALTPTGLSKTYYNVYWSTTLDGLFDTPKAITDALSVAVVGLHGGDGYYFAVRATYYPEDQPITQLNTPGPDYYEYPAAVAVNHLDGYFNSDELTLTVAPDTAGFPTSGYLKLGHEVVAYSSKTTTSFTISQRDAFSLGNLETHANGTAVELFKGIEDINLSFQFAVPTWDAGSNSPWLPPDPNDPDGYASMQDPDGYRAWQVDNLHEDHSEFETENIDFTSQDELCGTYKANTTTLVNLYTGNKCSTYFGGREDGFGGGVRLTDANLRREELLLSTTGEPFMLLRAKTTGQQCPRYSIRGEHSAERCALCYGTRILGGYDRYLYQRLYRPNIENPNGLIAMRVQPYRNDIPLIQYRGLSQTDEITIWAPAIPTIKKRDIIVRYLPIDPGEIPIEEFRYEVLNVERNRILFGDDGKQTLTVRKLDKTHEIYTYPTSLVAASAIL
jgi:hypothetical protein